MCPQAVMYKHIYNIVKVQVLLDIQHLAQSNLNKRDFKRWLEHTLPSGSFLSMCSTILLTEPFSMPMGSAVKYLTLSVFHLSCVLCLCNTTFFMSPLASVLLQWSNLINLWLLKFTFSCICVCPWSHKSLVLLGILFIDSLLIWCCGNWRRCSRLNNCLSYVRIATFISILQCINDYLKW